jgi:hypothetical protein
MANIRIFGTRCEYKLNQKRNKLATKSRSGILVGFAVEDYCYRIWDIEDGVIVLSRDVKFDEKVLHFKAPEQYPSSSTSSSQSEELDEPDKVEESSESIIGSAENQTSSEADVSFCIIGHCK